MAIRLQEVNKDNWQACTKLEPREDQRNFVAPNVYSLAEARFYPELVPLAVYDDKALVGFLMWGTDPDEPPGHYWIARMMIDWRQQGKGYGRAAMEAILADLKARPDCVVILLSYHPHNQAAERLYASLGFEKTGEIIGGEVVVRLPVRDTQQTNGSTSE
ncbi:MAG: GNAT family N-acetyltransferase [Chloroflexi bacterium]|nr:GNAT family N-acetyltransferase [Chloroflexota bacterium]